MGLKVFLDGKFVEANEAKISIFDHGILYGDGVFEGIRSYNRKVFRFKEHIDRLYASAEAIRLDIGMTKDEFSNNVLETLKVNNLNDSYIRAVVTRGIGDLGLDPRKCQKASIFIITDKIVLYPEDFYRNGLEINIARTRRNHQASLDPKIKSLNYLNNILAKIEAIDAGLVETLMLTVEGYVAECTGDNIFLVSNGSLVTPPNGVGALEGITQKVVMDLAKKKGIGAAYKMIKPEELFDAEECFLTGTAAEIIPVVKIDGKSIGSGTPGKITMSLLEDFRKITGREGVAY